MNAKLRLGFAGLVHDHVWDLAPQWRDQGVDFVAAADPNVLLLDRIRAEFDVASAHPIVEDRHRHAVQEGPPK